MYPPLNLPNEIPKAPALPHYTAQNGDPTTAWAEAWVVGYNSGWCRGADAEYDRGKAHVAIAERERNHIAQELVRVMEQRDELEELYKEQMIKYRIICSLYSTLAVFTVILCVASPLVGWAI